MLGAKESDIGIWCIAESLDRHTDAEFGSIRCLCPFLTPSLYTFKVVALYLFTSSVSLQLVVA